MTIKPYIDQPEHQKVKSFAENLYGIGRIFDAYAEDRTVGEKREGFRFVKDGYVYSGILYIEHPGNLMTDTGCDG
jgi:hypothetical protein